MAQSLKQKTQVKKNEIALKYQECCHEMWFIGKMRKFCIGNDMFKEFLVLHIAKQASLIDINIKSVICIMRSDKTVGDR